MEVGSLNHAIFNENFERVRKLVESGYNTNIQGSNGHTPLMQAVEVENVQIAQYLLSNGAEVNQSGYEGATPLHIAVDISIDGTIQNNGLQGDEPIEMITLLLKNRANKYLKNIYGKSPLDWALSYNSQKVIKALQNECN